jgi:hypothetical protein
VLLSFFHFRFAFLPFSYPATVLLFFKPVYFLFHFFHSIYLSSPWLSFLLPITFLSTYRVSATGWYAPHTVTTSLCTWQMSKRSSEHALHHELCRCSLLWKSDYPTLYWKSNYWHYIHTHTHTHTHTHVEPLNCRLFSDFFPPMSEPRHLPRRKENKEARNVLTYSTILRDTSEVIHTVTVRIKFVVNALTRTKSQL